MKKHTFYILMICLSAALYSCKRDFLDLYPQTSIAPEVFFKSEADLALYVNGLMNQPGVSRYLDDQSSDNDATTGAIEIKNIMTGSPDSKNITGGWSWGRLRDINYFLQNYGQASVDQAVRDHYAGLARYYRAQFYYDMVQRYSDVPWYSQPLEPSDSAALYMGRSPRTVVMDSIMADLAFAAAHVREDVPSGTPGLRAVQAVYARVALYEGTFRKYHPELQLSATAGAFLQTAKAVAAGVMASGQFSVYNTGHPDKDYGTLFNSQDLSSNPEVILNTPYDLTKKGAGSADIYYAVFGDYEQSPSRSLVQCYLMKDGTRFTDQPGYEQMGFVEEFKDRDPRMSQTIVPPGFMRVQDNAPYIQRLNKNFTGYHQWKGYFNASTDGLIIGSTDFPVIRYPEVLLTYAEAAAELGEITQEDLDKTVNLLRDRAGVAHLDLAYANAHPDPLLQGAYPDVSGPHQGVLLEIRRERRVEFALEGYRYDDLMRWHAGRLLEKIPEGMYFPGLGNFDLTGDGIPDIKLVGKDAVIPAEADKEKNSLGKVLVYYKAGSFGEDVTVYLRHGTGGGTLVTEITPRSFVEPKYYYRPVPYTQTVLNPNLQQIFGWE